MQTVWKYKCYVHKEKRTPFVWLDIFSVEVTPMISTNDNKEKQNKNLKSTQYYA